jgi:hypothetical protein
MKKKLDVESITNDLEGSAFFPSKPSSPTPLPDQTIKKDILPNPVPPVRDVHPVLPVRPVPSKRVMKQRWPIDIYQDQYETLKQLALDDRKNGGVGSMSAMIREAIDKLIADKRKS